MKESLKPTNKLSLHKFKVHKDVGLLSCLTSVPAIKCGRSLSVFHTIVLQCSVFFIVSEKDELVNRAQ